MSKIVLTSCGIINKELKYEFYKLLTKDINEVKLLYITTAIDGLDDSNITWVEEEFKSILNLGIKQENITEYKLEQNMDLFQYDIIYMLGGNTFYLLKKIKETGFDKKIKLALEKGIIYIGSSAGSIVLGNTIKFANDKNKVSLTDLTGLEIIDGIIIPHANKKQEFIKEKQEEYKEKIYAIKDEHGIIFCDNTIKEI